MQIKGTFSLSLIYVLTNKHFILGQKQNFCDSPDASHMLASALNQIQSEADNSSNDFSSTKRNAISRTTFKTSDSKLDISAAVESLTESRIALDNDYREIKTEITEQYDVDDIEEINNDISINGMAESRSPLVTISEELVTFLPRQEETSPKKQKYLKQDAPNVRMKSRKSKRKALKQMKRIIKHESSEKSESCEKLRTRPKSKQKIHKKSLLRKKQVSNTTVTGSGRNMKDEKHDESNVDDTDDEDLNWYPKFNRYTNENLSNADDLTLNSVGDRREKIFKCSHCDRLFSRTNHCRRHFDMHKKRDGVDKSKLRMIDMRLGRHSCKFCGEPFIYSRNLKAHLLKEHPDYRPYVCESCGLSFNQRKKLISHQFAHTKPFCCKICGRRFAQKSSLTTHTYAHHEISLPCKYCERNFKAPVQLRRHIKDAHLAKGLPVVKNHMCDFCGQAFRWTWHLKNHLQLHTGNKAHTCETCGKTFSRKDYLDLHKQSHTDVKSYICSVCSKSFTMKRYLGKHMLIHDTDKKLHKCEHCGHMFTRPDNLRAHLRKHSGEKM